jgi:hypothetical protein
MNIEELGRRAVACKYWRWMPGMLVQPLNSRTAVVEEEYVHDKDWSMKRRESDDLHPDLSDPATLGCLIALVREAYEDEWTRELSSFFDATAMGWRVGVILKGTALIPYAKGCSLLPFESEAQALVSALEGAP